MVVLALFIGQGVWPFSRAKISATLEQHFKAKLSSTGFHAIYFPHPGCILNGVVLQRTSDAPNAPFVSAQRLVIVGHYTDFLRHPRRLHLIEADGLRVNLQPQPTTESSHPFSSGKGKQLIVETFKTGNAVLNWRGGTFPIHDLQLTDFGGSKPSKFTLAMSVPRPRGELVGRGEFGPYNSSAPGNTYLSSDYDYSHADLSTVPAVRGILHSQGHIQGPLNSLTVHDGTTVADFLIDTARHPVQLSGSFDANVNATNGDVTLHSAVLKFRRTTLNVKGLIAGSPKTAALVFDSSRARIEDLLYLFLKSEPTMTGAIALHANTVLPPEHRKFVARLQLDGNAHISAIQFTHPDTQQNVNKLSIRAQGDADNQQPPNIDSDLSGSVRLRGGDAQLTNVQLTVPGARAIGNGHYNLLSKDVDIRGRLLMDAKLSQATTGVKSVLLMPFNKLFKTRKHGAAIGVSMTGTYPHPQFKTSLDPDRYKDETIAKLRGRHLEKTPSKTRP
ncbi:MAG: hypothetical protein NVS9B15_07390 [Acidobacteriaceae bacterium]